MGQMRVPGLYFDQKERSLRILLGNRTLFFTSLPPYGSNVGSSV